MTFISYAQNFEDVLLNRVFRHKTKGFYIDVGALHPTVDSVTKAFYDLGWSGINIEPIKEYYNIFQKERPRDINLNIAISNSEGNLDFFQVVGQPGNSTLNKEIADKIAQEKGLELSRYTVYVKTLAEVCKKYVDQNIDFLKIDVEGVEEEVILGGNWEIFRPTILVIETTLPNTNIRCKNNIPIFLREKGYQQVFFDGINDYYISEESGDLAKHFSFPVNILDNYLNYRFIDKNIKIYELSKEKVKTLSPPNILIDGIFFQLYKTGIARVWRSLLEQWSNSDFANHIIVLDRANTAPKINGIRYRTTPAYDYNNTEADKQMLQQICDEEEAELFISSYYTTPIETASVFMAYDMIPEVLGGNLNEPMWREKHNGIKHASTFIAISENTAKDLSKCFPKIPLESITVAHCGVDSLFSPASVDDIKSFKYKYGIDKPYFLLVGAGTGYKNGILFFQAFYQLVISYAFDIICTGSGGVLAPELRTYTLGSTIHLLQLNDEELALAYSGAVALVYPSKYEGFGMPVLEAMACGCPVITCANSSITEVARDAAIYVQDDDVNALVNALCEVQKPSIRYSLITAGLAQAKKFSWTKMAQTISSALINTTLLSLNLNEINLIIFPDWLQPEELIGLELQRVMKAIATHSNSEKTTLLIDTGNIAGEDAELFLSSVVMNLLLQEDLDVTERLEISLVENLADIQWQALLPRINARILLEHEDQQALAQVAATKVPFCQIDNLSNQLDVLLKQEKQLKYQLSENFIIYYIKEISISLPYDHALPHYQKRFRLYDKFIGVIAKYLPNNQDFVVDIGANVGDTTALLLQYCLNPIICIEADDEFFGIMERNLSEYNQRIILVNSFVSGNNFKNVELVKNSGTARAVESKTKIVKSDSLESIIKNSNFGKCILIKTDTDGFDFEILLSSLSIIKEDRPILYWENEISSLKDIELAKDLLNKLANINYTKYIVIDNFGNPLFYGCSPQYLEQINKYLFNNIYNENNTFYYIDIVAFPETYSHLIPQIASEYNDFIISSNVYP
ncbi:MAG: FkbM family methyltransferase [Nostoc sp.]